MFKYQFNTFYDWYVDNLDNGKYFEKNKDIAVYTITKSSKYDKISDRLIKKKQLAPLSNDENGYLNAFKKENINDIAKITFITNIDKYRYPNGLYCVIDNSAIYVVFPKEKDGVLCADHLSFMKDNVHQTTYTPSSRDINIGTVMHIPKSALPDGTELPLAGYNTNIFRKMHIYKDDILDICRLPQQQGQQEAGSGLAVTKSIAKTKKSKPVKKPEISPLLEQLLIVNDITSLKIFCARSVRSEQIWNISTFAESAESAYDDISFTTTRKNWSTIQKELCKLLQ
jgi:hypothetical protein